MRLSSPFDVTEFTKTVTSQISHTEIPKKNISKTKVNSKIVALLSVLNYHKINWTNIEGPNSCN